MSCRVDLYKTWLLFNGIRHYLEPKLLLKEEIKSKKYGNKSVIKLMKLKIKMKLKIHINMPLKRLKES